MSTDKHPTLYVVIETVPDAKPVVWHAFDSAGDATEYLAAPPGIEHGKVVQYVPAAALSSVTAERDALRERAERAEKERDAQRADLPGILLDVRGIDRDDACPACGGMGTRAYGSTSAWSGGAGGMSVTNGTCDACWGSGSKSRPGVNLREVLALRKQVAAATREQKKWEELALRACAVRDEATADRDAALAAKAASEARVAALLDEAAKRVESLPVQRISVNYQDGDYLERADVLAAIGGK